MRFLLPAALLLIATVVSGCREDGTVTVHTVTFNGVRSVDVGVLKGALATREDTRIPLVGARLPWSRQRNYFDRARFDADTRRIEAFYSDRGYPDARVEKVDVRLNTAQDAVDITVLVAEGDPVRVARVDLRGFDVIRPEHLTDLRNRLPLHAGSPRDRQSVLAAHDLTVNTLRDEGYAYARVSTEEVGTADSKAVAIVLTAEPGPLSHFGPIEIAGNQSVGSGIIRRQLLYAPGELYRRSVLQETQRRLYGMELFQFVNIESIAPDSGEPEVRTRVTVAEGKHQRLKGGVGYGTEEKARLDAEYHHVNFLGGARSAGVHARWSSLDRGARLDFVQPYFFATSLSLGVDAQRWDTFTPAYESAVTGGKVALTRRTSPRFSWTMSLSSERTSSVISADALDDPQLYYDLIALGLDPTTGKQEGTIDAIGFSLQHSTTDSVLNARRGYQAVIGAERAGGFLPGTFRYSTFVADARHYQPAGGRFVVANRLQVGNLHPSGDDPAEVPFAKKYFLGGASSIRGWGRYEVSPLGGSGLPIGGNTMLAFSSELRAQVSRSVGGVLFLDAGNVWEDHRSVDLGDLRYALGTGFRYQTPVGPIRFDLGYQLNPIPGLEVGGNPELRHWRIHFSIGQAF